MLALFMASLLGAWALMPPEERPFSGPADEVKVVEALPLVDFLRDAPAENAPRELRLVLHEALTLTDLEKQGIKGGGGVREVPVTVYGHLVLVIPFAEGQPDFSASVGEMNYLGVHRIGFRGPLRPCPQDPLLLRGSRVAGSVVFPMEILEPKRERPRQVALRIRLDLEIHREEFAYTPDPDPSIPPWRADKTKPSGYRVTGDWKTTERRADQQLELHGKIRGPQGCLRLRPIPGRFFPVQAINLRRADDGMDIVAHAAPQRVEGHDSQWAVMEFLEPLDLRRFNGVRLRVRSERPQADNLLPPAAAVAFRVRGQPWFACRTVVPLLGGERAHVVDFEFFARGTANPGFRAGPNLFEFPDLSQVDAIAVGVANPFGVGEVRFTALALEAVRHRARGSGEAPKKSVTVTVDPRVVEDFAGAAEIPPGLFGFHLANPSFQSSEQAPSWFEAEPIRGDGMRLLELSRPGCLRPLDHTNFSPETGPSMVHPLPAAVAQRASALEGIIHTITNENLWARPRWMDTDVEAYADGIRRMFRALGEMAWRPDRPDNTLRRIEFWNEPFMWARHINRGESTVSAGPGDPGGNRGRKAWNDPTQFSYMPGRLGAEMYARFFNAAAQGLRETNPHVQIGGMSSGLFGEDFFSHLTNYVAHFLEASAEHMDFLTEHHYSSHPPATAAAYETVTAWTLARHGQRWPIWNTEANDLDDIAPGDQRSPEAAKAYTDMNRAYYHHRDILELALKSRDKAAGRAMHALWGRGWFKNEGEQLYYLHSAALRGWVVASCSTDPTILPIAAWEKGILNVYLLNDSPFPRRLDVHLPEPPAPWNPEASGLRLADDHSRTGIFPKPCRLETATGSARLVFEEPIAPREILKISIPEVPEPAARRLVTQHFSDLLVTDVRPGEEKQAQIQPGPRMPAPHARLWLRIVARDIQNGEARLRMGSLQVTLPPTTAEGAHHVIQDIPVDAAWVALGAPPWPVVVSCAPDHDGFTVYSLSLLAVEEPPPRR